MPGLGHLPELLVVCLIALLVFGPKRVIDMGSALGRAVRELRESTKDLNWTSLLGGNEPTNPSSTSLGALSQFTQSLSNSLTSLRDLQTTSTSTSSTGTPPISQTVAEKLPTVVSEHPDGEDVALPEAESGTPE